MVRIADIFYHCNDLPAVRQFYTEVIGLEETFYSEEYKHLTYLLTKDPELTLVIMESHDQNLSYHDAWDNGPVFRDGKGYRISFSIRVEELSKFKTIVSKIQTGEYSTHTEDPNWVGYWSYMIKDPMGTTLDLYFEYDEPSAEHIDWSDI